MDRDNAVRIHDPAGHPPQIRLLGGEEAELDLDGVAPGYYALRAVAQVASGQQAVGQQVIRVETEDLKGEDGKTVSAPRVTLVDPTSAEVPEGMKIGDGPVIPLDGAGDKDAGNAG